MNGTRHVHVEPEWVWVDGHVTAKRRMQRRLRICHFLPVVSLRPMPSTGRYLSAMRSWPDILWSGLCSGGQAPQPAGGAPPVPGDRPWSPPARRSEPQTSRQRPPRDGSGSHTWPTPRNATRRRNGGTTTRHDRRRAHNCLLSLRKSRVRQSSPITRSSAVPPPDRWSLQPTDAPTTTLAGRSHTGTRRLCAGSHRR